MLSTEGACKKLVSTGEGWRVKQVSGRKFLQKKHVRWEYELSGEEFGDICVSFKDEFEWMVFCRSCGSLAPIRNLTRFLSTPSCLVCLGDPDYRRARHDAVREERNNKRLRKVLANRIRLSWRKSDLTGRVFGDLTVLGRDKRGWLCNCSCGRSAVYRATELISGRDACGKCGLKYRKGMEISEKSVLLFNRLWLVAAKRRKIPLWEDVNSMSHFLGDPERFSCAIVESEDVVGVTYKEFS